MEDFNLIKLIILMILVLGIIILIFNFTSNAINVKKQEKELIQREENIKDIIMGYNDNFKTIGNTDSAFIIEKETDVNGKNIRKDYYIFGEEGKNLIKIKEYEGIYENSTAILKKEIYIDLSKKVKGTENLYDSVTVINIEDWTSNVIDNYEFKTPIEKITEVLNLRYDFENDYKEIALDKRNEIYFNDMPELNHKSYGWNYEIKEDNKTEYLSFNIFTKERYLYLDFEVYDDNKRVEKISIRVSKLKGSLDDVTVPEL